MAIIQSKKKAVIQKGMGFSYIPASFNKEHKRANFFTAEDPKEILANIKPFEFRGRRFITFDTETHPHFLDSHLVPKEVVRRWVGSGKTAKPQDYPFCMSICDGVNAYSIFDTVENGFAKFKQLAPLFEDPTIEKIAHNWKYDGHMFANAGLRIVGRVHDTVVLAKIANENRPSFELRELAAEHKEGVIKFEYMVDAYKQTNKVSDYRQIPKELLSEYANADVWNCFLVFIEEYEKIEKDDLIGLYDKECELMIALYAMERYGVPIDTEYEKPLKEDLQLLVDEAEASVYKEANKLFNINSSQQLYDVLISLGVNRSWIPNTPKGNPQLNKEVLATLADKYDVSIIKKILEYRKNEKLLTTYAVGIYNQHDNDNKIHGNINQTEATTGRMSITKPALQTLPKKNKCIRRAFIPIEDYALYFMDLDQVEYRLFAHYAKIPQLLEDIKKGYDVHAATAALIYNIALDDFIKQFNAEIAEAIEMRNNGKTINFALIYGVGISHLSVLLKCSTTKATELKAHYFALLPEARAFIAMVYEVIKVRGFVKNFYGRRRRLTSDDCYKAPNALIQGCAADYIKSKIVDMYKYISYHKLKTMLVLVVHDEVVIMCHKDEQEHLPVLRWLLSDFTSFRCPITAGVEKGMPSWGQKGLAEINSFEEPTDKTFMDYNVYDGKVFDIYK